MSKGPDQQKYTPIEFGERSLTDDFKAMVESMAMLGNREAIELLKAFNESPTTQSTTPPDQQDKV